MTQYFSQEDFDKARKQRNILRAVYFIILGIYLAFSLACILYYVTLEYQSPIITTVKIIHYSVTAVFVIFSFIYLGIPFRRVRKYYKMNFNLSTGKRETSTGSFFEYDDTLQDKDGVDFKSLVFLEWNKKKQDFFERKVLVFAEREYPKFEEKENVRYVTQGNVLVEYEIL